MPILFICFIREYSLQNLINSEFYFYYYIIFIPIHLVIFILSISFMDDIKGNIIEKIFIFVHILFFIIVNYLVAKGLGWEISLKEHKNVSYYDMETLYVLLCMTYSIFILIYGSLLFDKIKIIMLPDNNKHIV